MDAAPATARGAATGGGLAEASRLHWREDASERTLRRDGRRWTAWTAWIGGVFVVPGALLIAIEPLTFPAAAICFAHAWAVPWIQARRGARQVVPIGSERSAARRAGADGGAEGVALGLLGDLVGHAERDLLRTSGLALQRGELGAWLVGEQGAILVRSRGRRADCWCVRVAETGELPAGDRVAHLLLALREDELGFAKVANLGFSGATWRVRRQLPGRARPALDAARRAARENRCGVNHSG
ncbi:MAG TPA: hypothetical protein VD765_00330 [Solirubrobacterales bacterium]|nr:hypothetical protein [Solirubrobacterales bacterium]